MRIRPSVSRWAACVALATFGLFILPLSVGGANASDTPSNAQRKGTGLPLPRFASLRADEVNVRAGPGARYPIEWVFKRKGMPVEIVAEYENYRKIKDWQGAGGWAHHSLLPGQRTFIIPAKPPSLHNTP